VLKKLNNQELELLLNEFITDVEQYFTIEQAVLYGSYAKGSATELSDIDVLIVSKDLPIKSTKGLNANRIKSKLAKIYPSIELIASHPEGLKREITKGFYDEVFSTGRVLRCA